MARFDQHKKALFAMPQNSAEIERKFVVEKVPENLNQFSSKEILQGYLAITRDDTEVRVRKIGGSCFLTVKHGSGKIRVEEEIKISPKQFSSLWLLTKGKRIEKNRYRIPYAGVIIELDVYRQRLQGLIIAEAEFPTEEASRIFHAPGWLGAEVTQDEKYKNRNLARYGIPQAKRS
jgi:adenylate cyclase